MNIIKRVSSWFSSHSGKDQVDEDYEDWKKSYEEWKESFEDFKKENQDLKFIISNYQKLVSCGDSMLKSKDLIYVATYNHLYSLSKVWDDDDKIHFVIAMQYKTCELWHTIRIFHDEDTEYAENCAREAFDYLTKEI